MVEEVLALIEAELRLYRVQLESTDGGHKLIRSVHATTMDEALVKAREPGRPRGGPSDDFAKLRVVEVSEEGPARTARLQRYARRLHINEIVEAGLATLGTPASVRLNGDSFGVLCDFFCRAVVCPGRFEVPSAGAGFDDLLGSDDDASSVMARLLMEHLSRRGLTMVRAQAE